MDVVDDESEGEDGGFDCLYLDEYCEEIECEEVENDEQQMTEPCATPKRRGGFGTPKRRGDSASMGSTRLAVTSIGRFTTVPCTSRSLFLFLPCSIPLSLTASGCCE